MENIENIENELVTEEQVVENPVEEVAENVETTAEDTPKTYSEEEFEAALNERVNTRLNEILPKRIARSEAKIRKEHEKKDREHEELIDILRAGTGKESLEEIKTTFKDFYQKKGIHINERPRHYSDRENEVLAKAEAQEIIACGLDVVVEETERLAQLGADGMDKQERILFRELAEYRQKAERTKELSKIGVTEDVYNSKDFRDFAAYFNSSTPITKIYELYNRETKPKKEIRTMGSMKNNPDKGVKDYYSPSEIDKLTEDELVKDHKMWEAVRRSMTGR